MPNINPRYVAGLVIGGAAIVSAMNQWEGDVPKVYADKLANGIPTVCSGHTDWKMKVGTALSEDDCKNITVADAQKYGTAVLKCTTVAGRPMVNQHQLDALTLFAVNVGVKNACGSRAVTLIKRGKPIQGCNAISNAPDGSPVWSFVNGKTFVQGLYNRRLFERDWCLQPMPAPSKVESA